MAEKYGVSVAQLCIRYCLQLGAVPLPKAMTPAHTVTLTQDYLMGETEVTEALWNAVMADGGGSNTHPKTGITWSEAHTFAEQLTLLAHEQGLISDEKAFRLPTEAQWEFAAKGGNLSQGYLYSGSDDMDEVAVTNENSGSNAPLGVKTKAPNELGLYDRWGVFMLIFVSDKTAGTGHATHPHFLSL